MPRVLAIGLYLDPPEHAVVLCVDEKTAIQALDRLDPVLPLSPGRAERHGFEYCRYGTLSLYTALEVGTGRVDGMPEARHASSHGCTTIRSTAYVLPERQSHSTSEPTAWEREVRPCSRAILQDRADGLAYR